MTDDLRYMQVDERRTILATKLARELFRYDQGFVYEIDDPDREVQEEYALKLAYIEITVMPIIEPFLYTGRIVHGDDVG